MLVDLMDGRKVRPSKILCIGRNFALHAREMGSDVPEEPVVFLKPASALIGDGDVVLLPPQSSDVHHEVELVVVVGRGGRWIPRQSALDHVAGYAVGLDLTARDLQAKAKKAGLPWSVAKGFDTFAPLGAVTAAAHIPDPQNLVVALHINGVLRQSGHTANMIFPVAALVSWCSQVFTLEPGDLIYTGTPEGVGPIAAGDHLEASATGLQPLRVSVATAPTPGES